jgi:outer membrane biosynthesis protein TonB
MHLSSFLTIIFFSMMVFITSSQALPFGNWWNAGAYSLPPTFFLPQPQPMTQNNDPTKTQTQQKTQDNYPTKIQTQPKTQNNDKTKTKPQPQPQTQLEEQPQPQQQPATKPRPRCGDEPGTACPI